MLHTGLGLLPPRGNRRLLRDPRGFFSLLPGGQKPFNHCACARPLVCLKGGDLS